MAHRTPCIKLCHWKFLGFQKLGWRKDVQHGTCSTLGHYRCVTPSPKVRRCAEALRRGVKLPVAQPEVLEAQHQSQSSTLEGVLDIWKLQISRCSVEWEVLSEDDLRLRVELAQYIACTSCWHSASLPLMFFLEADLAAIPVATGSGVPADVPSGSRVQLQRGLSTTMTQALRIGLPKTLCFLMMALHSAWFSFSAVFSRYSK